MTVLCRSGSTKRVRFRQLELIDQLEEYPRLVGKFLRRRARFLNHVPGGLGVLEATVSYAVPQEASIGALIAFRCAYFFIPLALGTTLLLISEIVFRRSRGTDEEADERAEAQSA